MNNTGNTAAKPNKDQALRLRDLIADVLQCCQERMLFESKTFDLPQAELKCLTLFRNEHYLTAKDIAVRLEVCKSRVTKVVNGLLEKGLVERVSDPRDGRVKLISLTGTGRVKMAELDDFVGKVHQRLLLEIEPQQRTTVLGSLELLRSSMEAVKDKLNIKG